MQPTFHIIEKILNRSISGVIIEDNYGNKIFLPKSLIEDNGLKIIEAKIINKKKLSLSRYNDPNRHRELNIEGVMFPFFVLANVRNGKNTEMKKLVAFSMFMKISQLISTYAGKTLLERNNKIDNDRVSDNFEILNYITIEFENYVQNKTINKEHFNIKSSEVYISESKQDKKECTDLVAISQDSKIYPWINYLNYSSLNLISFKNFIFLRDANGETNSPNCLEIRITPLFRHRINLNRESTVASQKIITPDKFKLFNRSLDFHDYLKQFYNLADSCYCNVTNNIKYYTVKYERGYRSEYFKKLYEKFNTHFVYSIQPYWHSDINKNTLERLHENIIELSEILLNSGVTNLIINPPLNDINNEIEQEGDHYAGGDDFQSELDHRIMFDLGDQEMRSMDDETGGLWGFENEFN